METVKQKQFTGERAAFFARDKKIVECRFFDGESPLKHSENIELFSCSFEWKYPLWYSKHIRVESCTLSETARAGIWYTDDIEMKNCKIDAPKTFRRSTDIVLENIEIPNAAETLWTCKGVKIKNVTVRGGDYLAMNCEDMEIDGLDLVGNYAFDGAKNVVIKNSRLMTKDAFWNSENITVYNSTIVGEYLGWNSKNLTLVDCTIESLQGLCYIQNLVMKNCRLLNTTLAFEYSTVQADIDGKIDSVLNPSGGRITTGEIGELILQKDRVDPDKTVIICRNKQDV
ncbi:MAG: DUF3737 family protein [Clostridiales bacterium]|nr:DUF3737 family protein [Clostridiales bacterium]